MKLIAIAAFIFLSACQSKEDQPDYTLFITNDLGDKEKIADFYQAGSGYEECMEISTRWSRKKPTCEKN